MCFYNKMDRLALLLIWWIGQKPRLKKNTLYVNKQIYLRGHDYASKYISVYCTR